MLARCPSCRATFATDRTGQQSCPVCKKPLFVPDVAQAIPSPGGPANAPPPGFKPPASERPPEPDGTPWERMPETPLVTAWKDTLLLALFEPSKLFDRARLDKMWEQMGFAVLTFSVFSIVGNLLEKLLIGPQQEKWIAQIKETFGDRIPPAMMKYLDSNSHQSTGTTIVVLLAAPLVAFIFVFANAGVTHLFAMLLGQNKRGFNATFAACAYAMAPTVLYAVPACGQPVAIIWVIVLTGVGLKHTHGMTTQSATAATLAPYIALCCLVCALAALVATTGLNAFSSAGIN